MRSFPSLLPFGWNDHPLPAGTTPARVIRHDGSTLSVVTNDGQRTVRIPLDLYPQPTVGDWLALDGERIAAVLERSSVLRRQAADERGSQTLAANVDVVLITCGIDRPVKPGRIHRSIAIAWDAGATPVLVLTKAEARDAAAPDLAKLELEHPGVLVLVTSALEGIGIEAVREAIAGRTAVLLGESGAGKSTLVNALLGRHEVVTGGVRDGDSKGKHTTTARQLHLVPGGGVIIDTPGIRSVGLLGDADAVDASFAEIAECAAHCRFRDCRHTGEPGCAVLAAVEDGSMNADRYDAWRGMQREVASAALRAAPRDHRQQLKRQGRAGKEGAAAKRGDWSKGW